MIPRKQHVPEGHPLRRLLHGLTEMSFEDVGVRDRQVIAYVSNVLTDFVHVDNLYSLRNDRGERLESLVDILMYGDAGGQMDERETHRYIGDHCMFIVGLFPENLTRRRRAIGAEFYIEQGKRSYMQVSRIDGDRPSSAFFRKMSDRFEECVVALHIETSYLNDPFYQYLIRHMLS